MAIISVSGKINSGKDTVGSIIQYLTAGDTSPRCYGRLLNNESIKGYHNSDWKIVKWADKLKDMICILLSCTREQLEDRDFKETELGKEWWHYKIQTFSNINPFRIYSYLEHTNKLDNSTLIKPTPRLLMQLLGTECGRQIIHPNVWVNATMVDYKCIGNIPDNNAKRIQVDETHIKYDNYNNEVYPDWIITDTRFPNEADAVKSRGGINIRIERDDYIFDGDGKRIIPTKEYVNTSNKQHESETALDNYTFDYVIDNNGTIEDLIIKVKEILVKENII